MRACSNVVGWSVQVIAHSMGAWVAFEFLCHARSMGLPMPYKVFISAMPYPAIPFKERPWKQQATLNEREFQVNVTRHGRTSVCHQACNASWPGVLDLNLLHAEDHCPACACPYLSHYINDNNNN
jgi:hypothetical protein